MVSKSSPWLLLSLSLSLRLSPLAVSPVAGFGVGPRLVIGASRSPSPPTVPSCPSPFCTSSSSRRNRPSSRSYDDDDGDDATGDVPSHHGNNHVAVSRHRFLLSSSTATAIASLASAILSPSPALALVKGNAPPPPKKPSSDASSSSSAKKCRNVEECQEQAEQAEALRMQREKERMESGKGPKVGVTEGGVRYLDVVEDEGEGEEDDGNGKDSSAAATTVKKGDTIEIYYKVLKLGKRSYDGLSGEGTVVFSRGYGLEDDETTFGDKSFVFTVGDADVIDALNEGVVGMTLPSATKNDADEKSRLSKRRISITPQKGWEKSTPQCDGGPGGSGAGGELRTDYVVVPTATMVEQEACFDKAKRPFPGTYAQERRMAQRFDQSLIVEVVLAGVRR
mmetsp:Transcript_4314/g.9598  ORF Transcript_4314/g.9598 Transcript_4314/m.9598 type:complete len:394 (-) Transcript_4314:268-1449(-)